MGQALVQPTGPASRAHGQNRGTLLHGVTSGCTTKSGWPAVIGWWGMGLGPCRCYGELIWGWTGGGSLYTAVGSGGRGKSARSLAVAVASEKISGRWQWSWKPVAWLEGNRR
jgi:hypothetical protein